VLPSELGDECDCGTVWKDWIGAGICWRQKGIGRDGVVDGRVDGESEGLWAPSPRLEWREAALALSLRFISAIDS
jgi:hypothetical protein